MAGNPADVPLILRGEIIRGNREFSGRRGEARFVTADVRDHLDRLTLDSPRAFADLYALSFEEIVDFLVALGERLRFDENAYLQEAYALATEASGLTPPLLLTAYRAIPNLFRREVLWATVENSIGVAYLEGWVEQPRLPAANTRVRIRAFGSRAAHIIAGNTPTVGVSTIIRNALTRSDAIIKTPSNDPLTSVAVARTMIDFAPDHPITRHLSVAYWKGGDEEVESRIYDPRRLEKIIAWGGFASIKHVTRYLQPGLDLITLDPKHSATIIGREALADEATMRHVATRLSLDIGSLNQEGCVNARVIYLETGTDQAGLSRANRFGEMVYDAIQALPPSVSTPHKAFDPTLRDEIEGLRYAGDDFYMIGGKGAEGAIIVSQSDAPVDFAAQLGCRVANIVPLDSLEDAVRSTNAYTQTVGIYPDALKEQLREQLGYQGAQRLVSLGTAVPLIVRTGPQDGIEPMRRMCKWITDETADADAILAVAGFAPEEETVA